MNNYHNHREDKEIIAVTCSQLGRRTLIEQQINKSGRDIVIVLVNNYKIFAEMKKRQEKPYIYIADISTERGLSLAIIGNNEYTEAENVSRLIIGPAKQTNIQILMQYPAMQYLSDLNQLADWLRTPKDALPEAVAKELIRIALQQSKL